MSLFACSISLFDASTKWRSVSGLLLTLPGSLGFWTSQHIDGREGLQAGSISISAVETSSAGIPAKL